MLSNIFLFIAVFGIGALILMGALEDDKEKENEMVDC